MDYFLFGTNIKKKVCILSRKSDEIKQFILKNMHSGATLYKVIGAYNNTEQEEIVAVVNKREYGMLNATFKAVRSGCFCHSVYN